MMPGLRHGNYVQRVGVAALQCARAAPTVKAERSIALAAPQNCPNRRAAWQQVSRAREHMRPWPERVTEQMRLLGSARLDWEEKAALLTKILDGAVAVPRPLHVVLDYLHSHAAKKYGASSSIHLFTPRCRRDSDVAERLSFWHVCLRAMQALDAQPTRAQLLSTHLPSLIPVRMHDLRRLPTGARQAFRRVMQQSATIAANTLSVAAKCFPIMLAHLSTRLDDYV